MLRFCCPHCRGPLTVKLDGYTCAPCRRRYPIVCGIPDFRLFPDPYISFEDEYEKARRLAHEATSRSFEDLLRFYWEITPRTPRAAAERYIQYALAGQERGAASLQTIDASIHGRWTGEICLEMGCGTGGLLMAARDRFRIVVGADIALRWLVVAQKRLQESKTEAILVCCSAEQLPFVDGTLDGVVGVHVLEHTQNPRAALAETGRTLKPGGLCFFSTPNRFSLGPEPCVRVWGVGFVPRSLAAKYVWIVKRVPYEHIRLLSRFELGRLLALSGLHTWSISPGRFADCELRSLPPLGRALVRIYHALRELPGSRLALQVIGPFLEVLARKERR